MQSFQVIVNQLGTNAGDKKSLKTYSVEDTKFHG